MTKIQRNLGVIHAARTVLVLSLIIALEVRQSYILSQFPWDMVVVIRAGPYGLIVLVALLEGIFGKQLVEEKMDDLRIPFCLMVLAVLIELTFAGSLRSIDGLILGIHVSFVIGLSAVEAVLLAIEYTQDSP
ncbi:MAG: hypothetical protein EAX87_10890 [Candidatus Thorarchaeota archaeon]|nr:hypothetical protein [Candidatus Thorarchaeota archaeon]